MNFIDSIKEKASFTIQRIDEIEQEVKHDVIAFLTAVNESVGAENAKYIHMGLTSSDVIDTAFALQIKDSSKIILKELDDLINIIKDRAFELKDTICIGRSHGVHAELMTFGFKLLNWLDALERAKNHNIEGLCISPKDYENREFEWYLKEAEAGDEIAMIYLAECYYYGIWGAKEDGSKAFKWYSKAVKGEDLEGRANCGLGNCYYFGYGVSKDLNEAVKWYRKAAEQGNADAQEKLKNLGY